MSSSKSLAVCSWIAAALLVGSLPHARSSEQPMFYIEVPKEGRIYVFAVGQRYDAFHKSGVVEIGSPAITRPNYGPNRETVVFDSEDAVNLYNFKHDLPGEYFPPTPEDKPKAHFPAGNFSGLMFGDYYWYDRWHADQIAPANPTPVEGQQGFWLRRVFFTYDLSLSETLTTRFRIETNSNGQLAIDGLHYAAQFGNDSGNGSESDKYKAVRFEGRYEHSSGIALELLYSKSQRPDDRDRTTAQGFAGYRNEHVRLGAQYLWQERKSGAPGVADQDIDIGSGFVVWNVLAKKADLFARVDRVKGDLGGIETGLPGAAGIDYLLFSADSPFTTWIVGGEWYLTPSTRLGPSVEVVNYDHDPDPVNLPGRDEARVYRITFFWTF